MRILPLYAVTPNPLNLLSYAHSQRPATSLKKASIQKRTSKTPTTSCTSSSIYLVISELCHYPLLWKSALQARLRSITPWEHRFYALSSKEGTLSNNSLLFPLCHQYCFPTGSFHHHTQALISWLKKFFLLTPSPCYLLSHL